jgi:hypothetical protein
VAVRDHLGTKPLVQIGDAELPELANAIPRYLAASGHFLQSLRVDVEEPGRFFAVDYRFKSNCGSEADGL